MALIDCPECNKQISDTAPHCIHCGFQRAAPLVVTVPAPGATPTTIERTSKENKRNQAGGAICAMIGFSLFYSYPDQLLAQFGGALLGLIGIVYYLSGKISAWWENE